jgi:hypothetical protein
MAGGFPRRGVSNNHVLAHLMPGAGGVHFIKRLHTKISQRAFGSEITDDRLNWHAGLNF